VEYNNKIILITIINLDSFKIDNKYTALGKLLFSFIKNEEFSFLFEKEIEEKFNLDNINKAFEYNVIPELSKNLNYLYAKFLEIPK